MASVTAVRRPNLVPQPQTSITYRPIAPFATFFRGCLPLFADFFKVSFFFDIQFGFGLIQSGKPSSALGQACKPSSSLRTCSGTTFNGIRIYWITFWPGSRPGNSTSSDRVHLLTLPRISPDHPDALA
ncbi:hypothetical protein ATANTOWER_000081 [Ataeniobius toweri]|uniref:Uncharacterized protein n=1 Tax=Ataeniobius toweri TaxID=208326 RepID=A0ABU7AVP1_9TELE|nr:hypothetical protein [Ataeniobius toweri]